MDIRLKTRSTVHFKGSFSSDKFLEGEGTVLNLSVTGCKVQSDTRVPIGTHWRGTHLRVSMRMPGEDQPLKINRAAVRWTRGQEFGLHFTFVEKEEEVRLRHLIQTLDRPSTT